MTITIEMAVFRKFKGPNIKYSHRDPQKALPYPERRHLTYFDDFSKYVQIANRKN